MEYRRLALSGEIAVLGGTLFRQRIIELEAVSASRSAETASTDAFTAR